MVVIHHRKVSSFVHCFHQRLSAEFAGRGHTTRFELPRTLRLSSNIPKLEASEKSAILCAFLSMCTLFQKFGFAMDEGSQYRNQQFYVAMHGHLRETEEHSQLKSDLQRADFLITQQWMRVVLWKASLFHVELSTSPTDEGLSLCLPDHIARNVVLHLNTFPTHIVEAHGLGMVCSISSQIWTNATKSLRLTGSQGNEAV